MPAVQGRGETLACAASIWSRGPVSREHRVIEGAVQKRVGFDVRVEPGKSALQSHPDVLEDRAGRKQRPQRQADVDAEAHETRVGVLVALEVDDLPRAVSPAPEARIAPLALALSQPRRQSHRRASPGTSPARSPSTPSMDT